MNATILPPVRPQAAAPGGLSSSISAGSYAFLQKFIYASSGIVVEADKHYLLESRLLPLLREAKLASLDELSALLSSRATHPLGAAVVEAMTTNETLFFRDPAMFEALRSKVLPEVSARVRGSRKIRIWSAAASTGQEAYSVAMMLLELGYTKDQVEVLGTDISNQVLTRAMQGKYVQFEVNRGLPAPMLMKYFNPVGLEWQIRDEVRNLVRFEQLDLRRNFRFLGSFDLIFCRNVLIYFDTQTKSQIVDALTSVLHPKAMLVLGCAETVINIHAGFQRNAIGQSTFYSL